MKKILLSGIILIVFSLLGWELGTGNFSMFSKKPSGTWEMVLHSKRPTFGDVAYNRPNTILSVIDDQVIYLYVDNDNIVDDDSIWMCALESNECTKTNEETFPVSRNIMLMTHDVSKSEIPSLPQSHNQIESILKIGTYGIHGPWFAYYILLTDGTVWRWYAGEFSFYDQVLNWLGGMAGLFIFGIFAATIIISLNRKQIEKSP